MASTKSSSPSAGYKPHPYDSALSMARAIKEGTVTSRQLVEMYIDRIKLLDKPETVNAVIDRDFEGALLRADEADEALRVAKANNEDVESSFGIFHGVPMTIKEGNPTPGFRLTGGDPRIKGIMPKSLSNKNCRIIIEEGGAILMGKTNLPINQCDWECNNPVYGRTGNPYNIERSPGGSSGGAAAALAAGLTAMELGSDIGGSIRIPAVMCGVVGHCLTRGINPSIHINFGLPCCGDFIDRLAEKFWDHIIWMGRVGPMARNIEDLTAMVELLGGEKAEGLRRPVAGGGLKDYRIAIWRSHDISPPGREVRDAMDKAVKAMKAAGATVDELDPPVDPMESYKLYLRYLGPFMGMHLPNEQRQNVKQGRPKDSFPSDIQSPFWEMDDTAVNGVPDGTKEATDKAMNKWDEYLKTNYDVVFCPIFPCEAWPQASEATAMLADAKVLSRKLTIDGKERYYGDQLFWCHLQVLGGFPATGFPVCFSADGLPVGLQAFGARGNDFILLHVVQELIKAMGMNEFQPPKGFA